MIVLIVAVLAQLSGEDNPEGIVQWGRARAPWLCRALRCARGTLPSGNSYRRVLGAGLAVEALEGVVRDVLVQQPGAGQSVLLSRDGKRLGGTIPPGSRQGVHLLSASLPAEGLVLMQVAPRVHKAHGRMETRRLLSSGLLQGYLPWPGLVQVFQLQRRAENSQGPLRHEETAYGLTSPGSQGRGGESPASLHPGVLGERERSALPAGQDLPRRCAAHQ